MDEKTSEKVANAAMNLVQSVTSSVETTSVSLQNTTNQHLADVKTSLKTLQQDNAALLKAVVEADKMRRLEFSLQNISLVSKGVQYYYYTENNGYGGTTYDFDSQDAGSLLTHILLCFRENRGIYITNYVKGDDLGMHSKREIKKEWSTSFRNDLSGRLHQLLGTKPRFDFESSGNVTVYYS